MVKQSFSALLLACTCLCSAQSLAQTAASPFTSLIEKNYDKIENGKAPPLPFSVDVVMAPDLDDLVATQSPVPKTRETFANANIVIRCTDKQGTPNPSRNGPADRKARYLTVTGTLPAVQIGTDTGAYESNMLPQFMLSIEGCTVAEREPAPAQAVAERTIALINTKAVYPGPTFACPDLQKCGPLAQLVTAEAHSKFGLGLVDIALVQPYQALRHARPDDQKALRDQASRFAQSVEKSCNLPRKFKADDVHGNLIGTEKYAPCVKAAYQNQRLAWLGTVQGLGIPDALEEVSRSARDHYDLQLLLAYHGLIPADARIDGSYGAGTRAAIAAVQKEANLPPTGFMSNATADYLMKKPDAAQ